MSWGIIGAIIESPVFEKWGIYSLFINGLFSSIIPIPVEATTTALLLAGTNKWLVFFVLTIGSIIGGFIAYFVGLTAGKALSRNKDKKKRKEMRKGRKLLKKYGWAIIFLSPWIPIFSDIVPMIAGSKKYDFQMFWMAMTTGKTVKAFAIVFLSSFVLNKFFM